MAYKTTQETFEIPAREIQIQIKQKKYNELPGDLIAKMKNEGLNFSDKSNFICAVDYNKDFPFYFSIVGWKVLKDGSINYSLGWTQPYYRKLGLCSLLIDKMDLFLASVFPGQKKFVSLCTPMSLGVMVQKGFIVYSDDHCLEYEKETIKEVWDKYQIKLTKVVRNGFYQKNI